MLLNLKKIAGHKITASDGDIGSVKDFYFDDKTWAIRYLVADTGTWLTGRQVLLAPYSFGKFDAVGKTLHVNLTRKQIENSPSIDTHRPVSRQYEENYYGYYGWPTYWEGDQVWGAADYPGMRPSLSAADLRTYEYPRWDDINLRSTKAVTGSTIEATDGSIGSVRSFLVDNKRWVIRDFEVETGHWYAGKEILIAPGKIQRISYSEKKVFVNLTKAEIQHTAENHQVKAVA
jgi:uncharacterized protein YrrD